MGNAEFNKNDFSPDVSKSAGFTLIELLIAVSIFLVIAISIYSAFNAGVFSWRRLNSFSQNYQQSAVALDIMANEIASYIPSQKAAFEGAKNKITFLSRLKNNDKNSLSKMSFFFDSQANSLMVSEESLSSPGVVVKEELLNGVKGLEFKYFCKTAGAANEYKWMDAFSPADKSVCSALSISITTQQTMKRVVPLYVEVNSGSQAQ